MASLIEAAKEGQQQVVTKKHDSQSASCSASSNSTASSSSSSNSDTSDEDVRVPPKEFPVFKKHVPVYFKLK